VPSARHEYRLRGFAVASFELFQYIESVGGRPQSRSWK
jgi:hypothetical protein